MSGHFTIDDREIPFEQGESIMDAARKAGIYIPHLCFNPELHPHGSCRLCTVFVNDRFAAACTTPAVEGARVENEIKKVITRRRLLLKMLFVEGNHTCPACEKSGACQLQAVAYHCGMLATEFTYLYPLRKVDASHRSMVIDFNRCILCGQCVQASRDCDEKEIFAISGRGINAHLVINSPTGKLGDSTFSSDDKAAKICPVGAILPKHKGYDVPIGQRLYDQESVSLVGDVRDPERRCRE